MDRDLDRVVDKLALERVEMCRFAERLDEWQKQVTARLNEQMPANAANPPDPAAADKAD